eukprot:scaffold117891_cov34-Tisochrysis_lutea.AAC.6
MPASTVGVVPSHLSQSRCVISSHGIVALACHVESSSAMGQGDDRWLACTTSSTMVTEPLLKMALPAPTLPSPLPNRAGDLDDRGRCQRQPDRRPPLHLRGAQAHAGEHDSSRLGLMAVLSLLLHWHDVRCGCSSPIGFAAARCQT